MKRTSLLKSILTALFAALIAVGAFVKIPLPPVPITLQTLFALISGLLLPLSVSLSSVLIYLFLGVAGLPIFTSGGGLAAITGPTGGYLIGLLPAVIVAGVMMKKEKKNLLWYLLSALLATIALYIPGLLWLGFSRKLTLGQTLAGGLFPFLIGDALKMVVAAVAALKVKPKLEEVLSSDDE